MFDNRVSYIINLYRFPLAVFVVYAHFIGNGEMVYSSTSLFNVSGYDLYVFFRILVSRVLPMTAVSAFFLISGYLFFQQLEVWDWQVWMRKIRSRCHTLVMPYFIWITCYVLYRRTFSIIKEGITDVGDIFGHLFSNWFFIGYYYNCIIADTNNISWIGTVYPTCTPILIPFWFIRDLIFMVFLSPVIFFLLKRIRKVYIFILLFGYLSQIWPVIPGISIRALFFFSLGGFLSQNPMRIHNRMHLAIIVAVLTCIICCVHYHSRLYCLFLPWFGLSFIIVAFRVGEYLYYKKRIRLPELLGKSSFFVFAFHFFLLDIWNLITASGNSLQYMIAEYILVPVLVVAFCVVTYYFMNKYLGGLTKLLVGR